MSTTPPPPPPPSDRPAPPPPPDSTPPTEVTAKGRLSGVLKGVGCLIAAIIVLLLAMMFGVLDLVF
ncbi:MAG: hypothetical protein ACRELD_14060 [Longimicrobiales bacterium]